MPKSVLQQLIEQTCNQAKSQPSNNKANQSPSNGKPNGSSKSAPDPLVSGSKPETRDSQLPLGPSKSDGSASNANGIPSASLPPFNEKLETRNEKPAAAQPARTAAAAVAARCQHVK